MSRHLQLALVTGGRSRLKTAQLHGFTPHIISKLSKHFGVEVDGKMDSYTPEEPPINLSCMRKAGCAMAGALVVAAWRRRPRCDSCDAFPAVYAQQTKRNQAMCSLMSAVLLRKANEQYSQQLRCCRNKTRRVRETIQQKRAEDASLTWRFPGNEEASTLSIGPISSPTLFVSHNLIDLSLVNAICDGAAQSGCFVAELLLHSQMTDSETTIR